MKVLGVMVGARAEKLHRASSFTADPGDLTPDTSNRATSTTDAPAASPTAVKKVEDVAPLRGATLDDVGGNPLSALTDLWLGMSESISKSVETVAETVASAVESLDLGLDLGMQTSSMRHTALELVIDRAARRLRNQGMARAFESWANLWRHLVHHRRLLACSHRFTSLRLAEAFSYWARPPDWVWKNIEFSNKQIACNWWRPRGLRQGVHTWRSWLVWRAHEKKQREKSQRRREPLSPMGMQLRSQLLRRRMASNRVQGAGGGGRPCGWRLGASWGRQSTNAVSVKWSQQPGLQPTRSQTYGIVVSRAFGSRTHGRAGWHIAPQGTRRARSSTRTWMSAKITCGGRACSVGGGVGVNGTSSGIGSCEWRRRLAA